MVSKESRELIGSILNWTITHRSKIIEEMNSNSQWEIWLQSEISMLINRNYKAIIREQNYNKSKRKLDILANLNNIAFAIELKLELPKISKTSDITMIESLMVDKSKLKEYPLHKKLIDIQCNNLSLLLINIGNISKYEKIISEVLDDNISQSFAVEFHKNFGIYGLLKEIKLDYKLNSISKL